MTNASILAAMLCICAGLIGGYLMGFYSRSIKDKLSASQIPVIDIEPPAVVGGALQPPKRYGDVDDNSPTGLVETKTPQRLDWEAEQAREHEGLRIAP